MTCGTTRGITHVAVRIAACLAAASGLEWSVVSAVAAGPRPAVFDALNSSIEPVCELESGWRNPPLSARCRCLWWWINGNVTREAISRDLEEMQAQGLGGAIVVDAAEASGVRNGAVPHGPDYASPQWRALFSHALAEADRLGLEIGLSIQSGWNLGGPTVTPEQAAKRLVFEETVVEGGTVDIRLPQPRASQNFYRDVALVAVPTPADASQQLARIENFRAKAYYKLPGRGSAIDASFLTEPWELQPETAPIRAVDVHDLSGRLGKDGRLQWQAPPGRWLILRFGYTLSGARVSTSSDNWKGLAIDYLDPAAFDRYWRDVVEPILAAAGPHVGKSLKYLFTDSWELGPLNWTPALPQKFYELRGYHISTYWPALAGYVVESPEVSARFLNDFRRTIGDLVAHGKYATFAEYAHARGLAIHPESGGPHAAPVDALQCLGRSDTPMGEFWAPSHTHRIRDDERLFTKQPASAAHIYGRRVVMADAFTTLGPHWERDPRTLKPVFDRAACEGLNLVALHTFDCSPQEMGLPGQAYFAGTHINPNVTWWKYAGPFFDYLNRCQFLLQQGLPVSDVVYFYGENVPNFVRLQEDDPADILPGFDYDVINAEALIQRTSVEDGLIVLPDGTAYKLLVLPRGNRYGLTALKQIALLVKAGATVVGEKPTVPFGLDGEQRFRELSDSLWSQTGLQASSPAAGQENVISPRPARQVLLDEAGPDFHYRGVDGAQLDYIHRRTSEADLYFVANRRERWEAADCSFRVVGRTPELWDPVSGEIRAAPKFRQAEGQTRLSLRLPPNGSIFVVFRRQATGTAGASSPAAAPAGTVLLSLPGPWEVRFDPKWGGPRQIVFDTLADWTARPETGIRYYSGTAVYRKRFDLPTWPRNNGDASKVYLVLGEVQNLARVELNGVDLGVAWTYPFRVEITECVRRKDNNLEVCVVNLWPNRLIGDQNRPPGERLTKTNIKKFQASSPLMPSGLLGPVRIVAER